MKTLVVRKVIKLGKLRLVQVGPGVISEGVLKLERVQVTCPACGEQVEAVARNGHIKGYCAVAKQYVEFLIEAQRVPIGKDLTAETRAKISAAAKKQWQNPEYRADQIATHIGKHHTTETRAKVSAILNTDEYRARHSVATKKLWQDPEYRAKQIATHTGKHPTAKTKAKISAALKRRHNAERGANEDK